MKSLLFVVFIILSFFFTGFRYGGEAPEVILHYIDYPSFASPSQTIYVKVGLSLTRATDLSLRLFVHLVKDGHIVVNADSYLPKASFLWKKGEVVDVGPVKINIPSDIEFGKYSLRIGLFYKEEFPVFSTLRKNGLIKRFLSRVRYRRLSYKNKDIKEWKVGEIFIPDLSEKLERISLGLKFIPEPYFRQKFFKIKKEYDSLKDKTDTRRITFLWKEAVFLQEKIREYRLRKAPLYAGSGNRPDYVVGFASSLIKIFRDFEDTDKLEFKRDFKLALAKKEFEAFQVVVIPLGKDLSRVRIFISSENAGLELKRNIKVFQVGYVKTSKPYYNVLRVGLWPDPLIPLEEKKNLFLKKRKLYPFWIRVFSGGLRGGLYKFELIIKPENSETLVVPFTLRIWNFSLPEVTHLRTGFGLYPYYIEKFYLSESSISSKKALENILELYYRNMLEHRISPIRNIPNPLLKFKDGEVEFDFKDFNQKAELYLRKLHQNSFAIGVEWKRGDSRQWIDWYGLSSRENLMRFFREVGRQLEEKGFIDKAYTYIFDETFHRVREITSYIHQANPRLKNLVTMYPDFSYPDVDIWCMKINEANPKIIKEVKKRGKEAWIYISSPHPPYPNFVIDTQALDYRVVGLLCWKFNLDGLLYWCVNRWNTDPWKNPMNFPRQNGNGFLYYPYHKNLVESIRLELIRDGIEDYEYLYLLNTLIRNSSSTKVSKEILSLLEVNFIDSFSNFSRDPQVLLDFRKKVAEAIVSLKELDR